MLKTKLNLHLADRLSPLWAKTRTGLLVFKKISNLASKFGRRVFEHKKINRILGTNLAIAFFASSLLQAQPNITPINWDDSTIIKNEKVLLTTKQGVRYPLTKPIRINQGYFYFHKGVDLYGLTGDPIYPIMDGTVENVQYSWFGYGNALIIDHGNGTTTLYAHLSKINVKLGDTVNPQSKIGEVGAVGHATGPHLHFEIRENNEPVNPLAYLPKEEVKEKVNDNLSQR